jgi:hypothetical protein
MKSARSRVNIVSLPGPVTRIQFGLVPYLLKKLMPVGSPFELKSLTIAMISKSGYSTTLIPFLYTKKDPCVSGSFLYLPRTNPRCLCIFSASVGVRSFSSNVSLSPRKDLVKVMTTVPPSLAFFDSTDKVAGMPNPL